MAPSIFLVIMLMRPHPGGNGGRVGARTVQGRGALARMVAADMAVGNGGKAGGLWGGRKGQEVENNTTHFEFARTMVRKNRWGAFQGRGTPGGGRRPVAPAKGRRMVAAVSG